MRREKPVKLTALYDDYMLSLHFRAKLLADSHFPLNPYTRDLAVARTFFLV